jgi:GntR family transcriptional regulator
MDEGDPIWIVERLRLADDEIISLCVSHLHLPSHVYLTPLELSTEGSLWSVLAKKGIQITEGEATIRATVADAHNANLLGVDEGSPSLVREGINYYVEDQPVPVEIFQVISCADRYQYSLHLIRQPVKN